MLGKLAEALNTTTDYLMHGSTEAVQAQLADRELLLQFHEVEQLPERDKSIVKELIDAFLTKKKREAVSWVVITKS